MGIHAYKSPEADRLVDDAIRQIGAEIEALAIPHLGGVVLGGGYGRGEGGVFEDASSKSVRLSNDLDFYVITEKDATQADIAAIAEALEPIGKAWSAKLGIDVDFCTPKTPWRIKHDQERLMIQELVHGYYDVAGKKGEELFRDIDRREPSALPWTEAVRFLVNRGAGILLCGEPGRDDVFITRNINKCILGMGDARLIARHSYQWKAEDRAALLQDELYSKAVAWKFRPQKEAVCSMETARECWLAAYSEINAPCPRNLYNAVRWLVRRRSLGDLRTIGLPPVVRILRTMADVMRKKQPFPPSLKKDWMIFN